jgi:phasin family protein
MSTTHQDKPGGKPRQRKGKADQQSRKPDQQQSPKLDRRDAKEQIGPIVASTDASTIGAVALADVPPADDAHSIGAAAPADAPSIGAAAPADAPSIGAAAPADAPSIGAAAPADAPSIGATAPADASSIGAVAPADAPSIGAVAPTDNFPISIQTIANAYTDYTRKSFEETTSFVEKLTGVRSLDKAIEIQAEFAKQAYENFVAESQKICELYTELAKQIFKPFAGLLAKATHFGR